MGSDWKKIGSWPAVVVNDYFLTMILVSEAAIGVFFISLMKPPPPNKLLGHPGYHRGMFWKGIFH